MEQPPGSKCPQVAGKFVAHGHLAHSTGTCGSTPSRPWIELQFTDGALQSPFGTLLSCTTSQADCAISVMCTPNFMKGEVVFDGMLSQDGSTLQGIATATGNYQGCSSVTYNVSVYSEK
jgi:hypothetical protein